MEYKLYNPLTGKFDPVSYERADFITDGFETPHLKTDTYAQYDEYVVFWYGRTYYIVPTHLLHIVSVVGDIATIVQRVHLKDVLFQFNLVTEEVFEQEIITISEYIDQWQSHAGKDYHDYECDCGHSQNMEL